MIQRFAALLLWCSYHVYGRPYMLLTNTRSKCFSVIAPHDQILMIEYHAPDLQLPEETIHDATNALPGAQEAAESNADGLDTQWNRRMKERLDRIKSRKLRDASITVTQKGGSFSGKASDGRQETSFDKTGKVVTSGNGRVREELAQKEGRIEFLTGKNGGTVEVCVQSILASSQKPALFHLKIDMAVDEEHYWDDDWYDDDDYTHDQKAKKAQKTKDPEHLEHRELSSQMSRLERDLQTLQNRVKGCINNADFNKDAEYLFHEQSISMNRATRYWPIIQVLVLLVTGFTQANHIVRYMKTHHIGI